MLAVGVTDPLRRHPAATAQAVATLDDLLGGRMALGLGIGEAINLLPYGIEFSSSASIRRARLREAVEYIKLLWHATPEKPANYEGRFYTLKDAFLTIKPKQTQPPIYLGGWSPRTAEMAGEIADGWYPLITSPESYKDALGHIERGAIKAGRNVSEIDAILRFNTAISDDYENARSAVEWRSKRDLINQRQILESLGYRISLPKDMTINEVASVSRYEQVAPLFKKAMEGIPPEAVDAISIFGTVDDCIGKIEKYLKLGARHVVIYNAGRDDTLMAYSQIISYFDSS
jgi:alkanesulfonate monooxygenase SsuD/methylene tetrahydromethanopterin reductase-like flavin-dependent oxidoreductase (luciferase family)